MIVTDDNAAAETAFFVSEPLGDGWSSWNLADTSRFNSFIEPLAVRADLPAPDGRPRSRLRMHPEHRHSNLGNNVHGAVIMALVDVSLFSAARCFGGGANDVSVTLDLSSQFVSGGRIGEPLDSVVELVRETGRLIFLRGMVVQGEKDEHIVASFTGTIRKISGPR